MSNLHIHVVESIRRVNLFNLPYPIAFAGTSLFGHVNNIFRLAIDIADWYGSQHIELIKDNEPNPDDFDSW